MPSGCGSSPRGSRHRASTRSCASSVATARRASTSGTRSTPRAWSSRRRAQRLCDGTGTLRSRLMPRDLDWPDCVNVRDLGGIATTHGRSTALRAIVRADDAGRLTPDGWSQARTYGVRTVLDLRSDGERRGGAAARAVPPDLDVVTVSLV